MWILDWVHCVFIMDLVLLYMVLMGYIPLPLLPIANDPTVNDKLQCNLYNNISFVTLEVYDLKYLSQALLVIFGLYTKLFLYSH